MLLFFVWCLFFLRGIIRRNSFWDYLVFRRVQQSLGGRVRIVVTGSAPISEKVMMFLRCSLGCHVSHFWDGCYG